MKNFLMHVLGTVAALFLGLVVFTLLALVTLAGLGSKSSGPKVTKNAVLSIDLSGSLQERNVSSPWSQLTGGGSGPALDEWLGAIDRARTDKRIKGLYLKGGLLSASPASLQELRQAIVAFKRSGKPVVAYADLYSQGCYYVCSAADTVVLNPVGSVEWKGLASQPIFFKDLLEKVGVKMQVFKVGTYKSYVEPYINTQMSPANREQVTAYLGSIWQNMVADVSASRKIDTAQLQALANGYTALSDATDLTKTRLVDRLAYETDFEEQTLCAVSGAEEADDVQQLSPADVMALSQKEKPKKKQVAVYYAFGDVVTDETTGSLQGKNSICADDVVADLKELAEDDDVRAVVLRVNSGGGSAYASEQIWHAVKQLRKEKPVVVSMGGMAASGAYYLACGTDYLMAEPTTLTGSIGIFGIIPDASPLLTEKLGLKFDEVKTNRNAGFGTLSRPLNAEESGLLQAYVERGYRLFVKRVADSRKLTPEQVDRIAQGRVWTGEQAKKIGLVDELGNLDAAIAVAARRAGLAKGAYSRVNYPEPEAWYESLMEGFGLDYVDAQLKERLGAYYEPLLWMRTLDRRDYIQARVPFFPNIY